VDIKEVRNMATRKQIAAARRNIKKAQAARRSVKPYSYQVPAKLKHKGKIHTPLNKVRVPLDKVQTLI
jgi:hypothetical protein